jgi:hypothetical protein
MMGVNRRKSVMGNGRWSGRSLGTSLGDSSGKGSEGSPAWPRALAAMLVLLVAGSVVLGFGSRRSAEKAGASVPASPIPASSKSPSSLHSKPDARAILGQLPLIFEPNQGQADSKVKFLARGAGYTLFLDNAGAVLAMPTAHSSSPAPGEKDSSESKKDRNEKIVRMNLVGANPAAVTAGSDLLPGKTNYLIGNDPQQWHRGIPQFAAVHYGSVYPGIDLVFYGNRGHLEYDFRVAPGADPAQAQLQFDGATKLELSGGDLILTGKDDGGLRLQAPHIYQRDGARQQPVAGRFVLRAANRVGFEIGPYDRGRELIIDPELDFATYFGGTGSETFPSVAVNGNGNIYLVGTTQDSPAASFPDAATTTQTLIGPLSLSTTSPSHIFVTEIDPSLPSVVYETFIGGTGSDTSIGISVDAIGNAYIVGNTTSKDFPTLSTGYQTAPETKGAQCDFITCYSVFVSALNPIGSLLNYSSYLSGNGNDLATGMTIDTNADIFVTGTTTSNDTPSFTDAFPATYLPVPYQASPKESLQFFVTMVDTAVPGVGGIAYSTYFGGNTPSSAVATGGGIAVDSTGNIYFSGTTNFYNSGSGVYGDSGTSGDFPILNAYQPCLDTPPPTVLSNPNPCAPPPGTPYPTDAFVAKLNSPRKAQTGAAQLLFSTYLGGSGTDSGPALTIDSGAANIYLTGSTNSADFVIPTGAAAFQLCLDTPVNPVPPAVCLVATGGANDAYVARMTNPLPSTSGVPVDVQLTYFSYLGGTGTDSGNAISVDTASNALVTGTTNSIDFPVTPGAIQGQLGTGAISNSFFARIDTSTITGQNQIGSWVTYYGGSGADSGTSIVLDPSLNTYFAGQTTSNNLETDNPLQPTLNGSSNAFIVKLGTATDLCITCVQPVLSQTGIVSAGNPLSITYTVTNEGPDVATGVAVSGMVSDPSVTFVSASAGSGTCSAPSGNQVICTIPTLQSGSISAVTFTVTPTQPGTFSATATVFNVNNTITNITNTVPFTTGAYSVSMTPLSQSVVAGQPAQYTVNVTPNPVFGANVALTCSAVPVGAACNFTSSTVTLNQGTSPASTVLNLTTTAQPVTTASSGERLGPLYALGLMIPGMAWLGLGARGKRRGKGLLGLLTLSVLFALVMLQPSCSGNSTPTPVSGTPSGTYNLTVTATSGSYSQAVAFQLTVSP